MRELGIERRRGSSDLGACVEFVDHVARNGQQILYGASLLILYVELETAADTISRDHRLCECHNVGRGDVRGKAVDLRDDRIDVITLLCTLLPRFESQDEHTVRRALTAYHTVTCNLRVDLYLRYSLDAGVDLVHNHTCLLEAVTG